ncbi:MAG: PSD1 and planctomycete cytochrome C domain-containing protein [Pirellulaceae bacterium]
MHARSTAWLLAWLAFSIPLTVHAETTAEKIDPEQEKFFEEKVRPLLATHCYSCHGPEKQESGLRLDSRKAILLGSESGKVAEPGNPEESSLIHAIRYEGYEMPPEGQLKAEEIKSLEHWVKLGMPWPAGDTESAAPLSFDELLVEHRKTHWSYQPITDPAPPSVEPVDGKDWPRNELDHFVLSRLQAEGMTPSPEADKRTLIRRATYSLHGLPPTPEEVASFESDTSEDAYAKVIDRLLESPRYGQHWGRHWLDVARYSDTRGYAFGGRERRFPHAYTYRDYVVEAMNADLPYDQFIKEQLAADFFVEEGDTRLAALGLIRVGRQFINGQETIDDRVDVVTRGLQAMTVSCARCHNHKYDALHQADYYSLHGVFSSIEEDDPLIGTPNEEDPAYQEFKKKVAEQEQKMAEHDRKIFETVRKETSQHFFDYLIRVVMEAKEEDYDALEFSTFNSGNVRRRQLETWNRFLEPRLKAEDPVWGPLAQLKDVPEDQFAAKVEELKPQWQAEGDTQQPPGLNPMLRDALIARNPTRLIEVVDVYEKLFQAAVKPWAEGNFESGLLDTLEGPQRQLADAVLLSESPLMVNQEVAVGSQRRDERAERQKFETAIVRLSANDPGAPPRAMAVKDKPNPVNPVIFLRGNPGRRGDKVDRRFLQVLKPDEDTKFKNGSGRLELAQYIVADDNPLTARVMVNRVWMQHFDRALVTTPSDFGIRSDAPSHPDLLDHLATKFRTEGWSLKKLHRYLLSSATYRQTSIDRPEMRVKDPENKLLWKMNRRRLRFEEVRDSLLATGGNLDDTLGGRPIEILKEPYPPRRTLYGLIDRQELPGVYRAFDFPNPDATSPERPRTTVPQQALYMMNNPFTIRQAELLAQRARDSDSMATEEAMAQLYQVAFQRSPTDRERELILDYLEQGPAEAAEGDTATTLEPWVQVAHLLLQSNEFMFVD